jgi:hypothetical protein
MQPTQLGPQQVKALFDFMYQVSIRLETVESLIRKHYTEDEFQQALEEAQKHFPSPEVFPEHFAREYLLELSRIQKGTPEST